MATAGLTIDELARRSGMTVRNVRAHQARGLLPPPDVRGRTGYYNESHVARLELIKDMQADGFNLRAIRHALAALPPGTDAELLNFRRSLLEPWLEEEPELLTGAELTESAGVADPALVQRAVDLGLIRPVGADQYEVQSPSLLRAGAEVVSLGIPAEAVLETVEQVAVHAEGVARAYVRLYLEHVWRPFRDAGQPEDQWPAMRDALSRMQPLATASLLAVFRLAMTRAVEQAMSEELAGSE